MYGTIARIKIDPTKLQELIDLGQRMDTAPGQIARYVYRGQAFPETVSYTHLDVYKRQIKSGEFQQYYEAQYGERLRTAAPLN